MKFALYTYRQKLAFGMYSIRQQREAVPGRTITSYGQKRGGPVNLSEPVFGKDCLEFFFTSTESMREMRGEGTEEETERSLS